MIAKRPYITYVVVTDSPARQVQPGICPRCGGVLPIVRTGRRRRWCSQRCRRAAYEERRAARNGAIAVEVVKVVEPRDHDISECAARVLESPAACRRVIDSLDSALRAATIRDDPRWSSVVDRLTKLVDAELERRVRASRWRR